MAESKTYAELEIAVDRRFDGELTVHLRFSEPHSDSEESFESTIPLKFDFEALRQTEDDAAAYGRMLSASLFADPKVREKLERARSFAAALRLRLFIGLGAKDLHSLRWETLRHPGDDSSLTSSERVLFSRYLSSYDWRRVSRRARGELRALVAIANPTRKGSDGSEHAPLAPIDVATERKRAEDALTAEIPVDAVDSPVTLDRLIAAVREHRPDILYVVCHGGRLDGNPVLYLEGETTWVEVVAAAAFATALQQLEHQPRLVVLASCQSAGSDRLESEDGALVSLGPRLAESGIPAVVAMQGAVQIGTVADFMQEFFADLRQHGEIDLAMAHARNAVQDQSDFWMPVLFHRLKDGRIWYEPSFVQDDGFQKWPALIQLIKSGYCTPILGTGMTDAVFGPRREIARRWAEAYGFPLAPQDREDLPQVAQFLTVKLTEFFPFEDLKDQVRLGLLQHHRGELPAGLAEAELGVIAEAVGRQMRENDHEPHRVLAGLDLPVFITTNPDNLLADALRDAGKEPHVELFHWSGNDEIVWPPSIYDDPANTYKPSAQQPLVYHLFGHLDYLDTLVLTEDDYFDFLIGFTKNRNLIPEVVRSALTKNALLFVGFEMDDWDFRVIFRSIVNMEGIGASRRFGSRGRLKLFHVGVQVAPDEGRFVAADSARKYIEKYFGSDRNNISIYWGNPADFAGDLLDAKRASSPRGSTP